MRRRPQAFAFMSAPADTPAVSSFPQPHLDSLDSNNLCRDEDREFTAAGITALCEGLKGSTVTSLRCAAAPKSVCFCVRAR